MTTFPWFHHRSGARADRPGRTGTVEPFWQMMSLGLLTVLFGIAVLAWPDRTLRLVGLLAGIWLFALGVMRALAALDQQRRTGQRLLSGVTAVVLIAAGVTCMTNTASGVLALGTVIGLAWLLTGFAALGIGMLARGSTRVWMSALGVASMAVGLTFILWPAPSVATLVLLTGISALVIGAAEVTYALRLRHDSRAPDAVRGR